MISVDGSMMEGGGQLLRYATSYSAILKKPVSIYNIRAKRKKPGLRPQHLATLMTAAKLSGASVKGAKIGSTTVEFSPSKIRSGVFDVDIGTAGSISLLLQCIQPISCFSERPIILHVKGGTAVNWSPTLPFIQNVVYPAFGLMSADSSLFVERHGFYPKGGGSVTLKTSPITHYNSFKPGIPKPFFIEGVSICGRLPSHVADRQRNEAILLLNEVGYEANIKTIYLDEQQTFSPGSMICLWVKGDGVFLGADSLGERGKRAEAVGSEAANDLLSQLSTETNVDRYTCDHLILPCSLAAGESQFRVSEITLHTLTAIEVSKLFTDVKYKVEGRMGQPGTITIQGTG